VPGHVLGVPGSVGCDAAEARELDAEGEGARAVDVTVLAGRRWKKPIRYRPILDGNKGLCGYLSRKQTGVAGSSIVGWKIPN